MTKVLAGIDAAFAGVPKPEHFTDHTHGCECKEHDDTLRSLSTWPLGGRTTADREGAEGDSRYGTQDDSE